MASKLVTYLRVSTTRQGSSGLGLEAQRNAVETYARHRDTKIAREFVEVESGKHDNRPQLAQALAYARRAHATLLVAKLDRLSRNVRFIATVLDSGVEFAAADVPNANRLLLHVLAAVAENEAKAISDRTKAALGAAKARGVRLGAHNPLIPRLTPSARRIGQQRGARVTAQRAVQAYADLLPLISTLRASGATLQAIADRLNDEGHETRQGAKWTTTQIHRILKRIASPTTEPVDE